MPQYDNLFGAYIQIHALLVPNLQYLPIKSTARDGNLSPMQKRKKKRNKTKRIDIHFGPGLLFSIHSKSNRKRSEERKSKPKKKQLAASLHFVEVPLNNISVTTT